MSSKYRFAPYLLAIALGACAQTPSTAETTSDARIKALVDRTLKHLVFLEGGSFEMGDWCGPKTLCDITRKSKPLHKVTLDSFSIMAYQATYDDFDVFTDAEGEERINMDSFGRKNRSPKRHAAPNWYGAKAFCQWLGQQTKLPFDLPTEAQWEFAARSRGQNVLFATDTGKIDWGRNFPPKWEYEQPKPPVPDVGSYPPNPAGLYGMSEGAMEWVNDWYAPDYYKNSPENNPQGPETGSEKIMRGSVGGEIESANLVMMRTQETPRTTTMELRPQGGFDKDIPIPGYSSLPSKAVRCVVNSQTPIKHPD